MNKPNRLVLIPCLISGLAACHSGSSGGSHQTYQISGTVNGLTGSGLILQNNAADNLTIAADGPFSFSTKLSGGASYSVTVLTQPSSPTQTCSVSNGSGSVSRSNITDISISCVDDFSPTVTTVSPASGSANIEPSASVTASFSERMLSSTINTGSFTLSDGSSVAATVDFNSATNIATLIPDQNMHLLSTYNATLNTAVSDLSGNGLASAFSWSFTIRDGSWTTDTSLSPNNIYAEHAQIAADSEGNAIAVWQQTDGTTDNIYASRYTSDNGWSTPELVESSTYNTNGNPVVAMDVSGNAMVLWTQSDGSARSLWSNRYLVGSGWGTPELVESILPPVGDPDVYNFRLAINSSGNAFAVWGLNSNTKNSIWSNQYVVGSGLGTPELLETNDTESASNPRIAIDNTGNAVAVWSQYDGSRYNNWANSYTAGSGWGSAELVESSTYSASQPEVAMDQAGSAIVVFSLYDGSRDNVYANHYVFGSGWGTPELIETDDTDSASGPRIAFDADGNAIAAWEQGDGSVSNIWANRYIAGSGWGTPELVESSGTVDTHNVSLSVDANGNAIAAWEQYDYTINRYSIWANRYITGSGWASEAPLETDDSGDAQSVQVVISGLGTAFAVWKQEFNYSTDPKIQINQFE